MGSLQERLGAAVAHVPKSGKEAQEAANSLYEGLERLKDAVLKQSGDLPTHISKAVQPYVEKLQKAASDVQTELGKKDVPIQAKAAHIIAISRDITAESLHEALEALRQFTARSKVTANGEVEKVKENGDDAVESIKENGSETVEQAKEKGNETVKEVKENGSETAEKTKENGSHAVESTEQFVEEHTPGDISYAEAVKEPAH